MPPRRKHGLPDFLFAPPHRLDELLDDNRQFGRLSSGRAQGFPDPPSSASRRFCRSRHAARRKAPSVAMNDGARVDGIGLADADDLQPSDAARVGVNAAVGFEDRIDHESVEIPVGHAADACASVSSSIAQTPRVRKLRQRKPRRPIAFRLRPKAKLKPQAAVRRRFKHRQRRRGRQNAESRWKQRALASNPDSIAVARERWIRRLVKPHKPGTRQPQPPSVSTARPATKPRRCRRFAASATAFVPAMFAVVSGTASPLPSQFDGIVCTTDSATSGPPRSNHGHRRTQPDE